MAQPIAQIIRPKQQKHGGQGLNSMVRERCFCCTKPLTSQQAAGIWADLRLHFWLHVKATYFLSILFEFFTKHFYNDPISFAVWNFPWCLYRTKVRSSGIRLKGQLFNEIVPHKAVLYAITLGFCMWTMHIPLKQTCILL